MLNLAARRVVLVAALATVVTGCGARPTAPVGDVVIVAAPAPQHNPVPLREPTPAAKPGGPDPAAAAAKVEPNTILGAVLVDRTSGAARLSVNADRQFRSASLVKLLIAIDALRQGVGEREWIARMLSASDDDIASSLWTRLGPGIVPRVATRLGLRDTEAPELAGKWGETRVTANDVVRLYQYVLNELPAEDRTLIVDALARAPRYAADGFD